MTKSSGEVEAMENPKSRERRLVVSVMETTLDSVAVLLAEKIHRSAKENASFCRSESSCESLKRRHLFPGLYGTEAEVETTLEAYGVEVPKPNKRVRELSDIDPDETVSPATYITSDLGKESTADADEATSTHSQNSTSIPATGQTDIWGRYPPKELKNPIDCPICGRQVNTLRFAPHLDKCMGIGTTSRAASTIGTTARNS